MVTSVGTSPLLKRSFTRSYLTSGDNKAKDAQARSNKESILDGDRSSVDNRASTDGRPSEDPSDEETQRYTQTDETSRRDPNASTYSSPSSGLLFGEIVRWTDDKNSDLRSDRAERLFKPPPGSRGETAKNDDRDNERHGAKKHDEKREGAAARLPNT